MAVIADNILDEITPSLQSENSENSLGGKLVQQVDKFAARKNTGFFSCDFTLKHFRPVINNYLLRFSSEVTKKDRTVYPPRILLVIFQTI